MRKTILIILLLTSVSIVAQENPQDLGKMVFTYFKTKDYEALSKLTPKPNEALNYYRSFDSTLFKNEREFKRKYISRDSMFVEKCIAIMMGKTGVEFRDANLIEVRYFEKNPV